MLTRAAMLELVRFSLDYKKSPFFLVGGGSRKMVLHPRIREKKYLHNLGRLLPLHSGQGEGIVDFG